MLKRTITQRDSQGKILKYTLSINGQTVPDNHIYCKACDTIKPMDCFSLDKKGRYGRTSTCKPCASTRAVTQYAARMQNKDWAEERRKKLNKKLQERKRYAVEIMGGACQDCGGVFHQSVYDFHHLDPSTKENNPSSFMLKSEERLKEELNKCVLLCANCHRTRHFKEGI